MKKFFIILFILSVTMIPGYSQVLQKNISRKADNGLAPKSVSKKKGRGVKAPGSVSGAKEKQEANDRKLKKDYEKSVKESQKRTVDIQTPEVRARMKQNKKETAARERIKKKKTNTSTRKAGKKYK